MKGNFVDGIRCELAEAVACPGAKEQVLWRISGVAQYAETALALEVARMKNQHQVEIGTLRVWSSFLFTFIFS